MGWKGINYLWEVKGEDGILTPQQVEFHDEWQGTIYIVRTLEEAMQTLEMIT